MGNDIQAIVFVLFKGTSIEEGWRCFIVHHAQVTNVGEAFLNLVDEDNEIGYGIVIHPERIQSGQRCEFDMTRKLVMVQNQCGKLGEMYQGAQFTVKHRQQ